MRSHDSGSRQNEVLSVCRLRCHGIRTTGKKVQGTVPSPSSALQTNILDNV